MTAATDDAYLFDPDLPVRPASSAERAEYERRLRDPSWAWLYGPDAPAIPVAVVPPAAITGAVPDGGDWFTALGSTPAVRVPEQDAGESTGDDTGLGDREAALARFHSAHDAQDAAEGSEQA